MKQGQTEIIGVAVIVIILVIAGTFMIISNSPKDSQITPASDAKIAQSFLYTLMNTKTQTSLIVSQIIKDCYDKPDRCGINCCDYAETTMNNALKATLKDWEKDYRLQVYKGTDKRIPIITNNYECNDDAPKEEPGYYHIPDIGGEWITVKLDICY